MGAVKRILLTGASGYLGRNLVDFLLESKYELILLVRAGSDMDYIYKKTGIYKIYRIGSITTDELFCENQIDLIIHTAACYGRKGESTENVIRANLSFPIGLLESAVKNGIRYFINTDTSLPKELNAYSRSKKQFLEWLTAFSSEITVINVQLEYFYGPNDDPTKFITFVLNELQSKETIDFTDATQLRDFIYIDDVVQAYDVVIKNIGLFEGIETLEVGSGKAIMLRDLIEEIRDISNYAAVTLNFGALPMRPNEVMESYADICRLCELGWQPQYTFRQGILKTVELEKNNYGNN